MKLAAAVRAVVATAAAAAGAVAVITAPPAGAQGACTPTSGVTVVVDFSAFGRGLVRGCAPGTPATGYDALVAAGFAPSGTTRFGNAFVCRIDALPSDQACVDTPPSTAYWAYYHASPGDATWRYSTMGAAAYHPQPGSVEAWAFGAGAKPGLSPSQVLPPPLRPPTTAPPRPPPPTARPSPPPTTSGPVPAAAPRAPGAPTSSAPPAIAPAPATSAVVASRSTSAPGSSTSTTPSTSTTADPSTSTTPSTLDAGGSAAAAPVAVRDAGAGPSGGGSGGSPLGVVVAVLVIGALAAVAGLVVRGRRLRT